MQFFKRQSIKLTQNSMQTRGNNRSKTIKEINAGITFLKNPESKKSK